MPYSYQKMMSFSKFKTVDWARHKQNWAVFKVRLNVCNLPTLHMQFNLLIGCRSTMAHLRVGASASICMIRFYHIIPVWAAIEKENINNQVLLVKSMNWNGIQLQIILNGFFCVVRTHGERYNISLNCRHFFLRALALSLLILSFSLRIRLDDLLAVKTEISFFGAELSWPRDFFICL